MTQQEYENKIKDLENQIAELKAMKIEEPQSKRWKPKDGEEYWLVQNDGDMWAPTWDNDTFDKYHHLTGNCFKSKEEAEEYKKQIEYTARYKNYIEEHSELLDWNNTMQEKYFAQFCCNFNEIEIDSFLYHKVQGIIYASSEEIIWNAIKEIGEDNFKKYVLGVK